jgi:hypothetical protein
MTKQIIIYNASSGETKRVGVTLGDVDPSDRQTLEPGEEMLALETPQDVTGMKISNGSLVENPAYTDELAQILDYWQTAVTEKESAASAYQSASSATEKLNAVAQYTLAQDSQIDATSRYLRLEEGRP